MNSPGNEKHNKCSWRNSRPLARRIIRQPLLWMLVLGMTLAAFVFVGGGLRLGLIGLSALWLVLEACFVAFQSHRSPCLLPLSRGYIRHTLKPPRLLFDILTVLGAIYGRNASESLLRPRAHAAGFERIIGQTCTRSPTM